MKRILVAVGLCVCLTSVVQAEGEFRFDIGGGVVQQDIETTGIGFDPVGFFATAGWTRDNGFLVRLNISRTEDEGLAVIDFGFGLEPTLDEGDINRLAVVVGFLFNRGGLVRPFIHGGIARIDVEESLFGTLSGSSVRAIDDDDSVLTIGGGIEIGQDNHIFLFDVSVDEGYDLDFVVAGFTADFDVTEIRIGYVYRF